MENYPIEYEVVAGEIISPAWKGKEVPVPPEWVRNYATVTERYKYACLAKELEDYYPTEVREKLVEYVKNWPEIRQLGQDMVIAGNVPHVRRVWTAAAVMNEIIMRFGPRMNLTTSWLSVRSGLSWLLDAKDRRAEEYVAFRNRALHAKLLLVDNPLLARRGTDGGWFIQALYEHRFEHRLPTISTLPFIWDEDGRAKTKRILGSDITHYIESNGADYIINWTDNDTGL